MCPNHPNTLQSSPLAISHFITALLRTSSLQTPFIRDTLTKLLKRNISITFTFLLSAFVTPELQVYPILYCSATIQHLMHFKPRIHFTSSIQLTKPTGDDIKDGLPPPSEGSNLSE